MEVNVLRWTITFFSIILLIILMTTLHWSTEKDGEVMTYLLPIAAAIIVLIGTIRFVLL